MRSDRWDMDAAGYPALSGGLHDVNVDDGRPGHARAVLWVPDPESRSGWRDYVIWPEHTEQPRRGMGW